MINESGINVLKDSGGKQWRFVFLMVLVLSAMISLAMASILSFGNFDEFVIPMAYVTAISTIIGNAFIINHYGPTIGKMLHHMDENLYTYPDEHLLNVNYSWYTNEQNIVVLIHYVLYAEASFIFIALCPPCVEIILLRKINVNAIYPCWAPWKLEDEKAKLFTMMFQIIQGISALWLNYLIIICIFIITVEFMRQFERLRAAISSLKDRTDIFLLSLKDLQKLEITFDDVMHENIIRCIEHHQILFKWVEPNSVTPYRYFGIWILPICFFCRNFQLFKTWFSKLFSLELAICCITFVFELFSLVHVSCFFTHWSLPIRESWLIFL